MPFHAPPSTDERELIAGFLRQQQDAFRAAMFGLTDEQAGRAAVGSTTLSVGTLLKHAHVTQKGWVQQALAAPELPDWDGEALMREREQGWTWAEEDTVSGVLAAFDDGCRVALDAVRVLDLDTVVPVPPAPWNPSGIEWSIRWVWLHLIEELARHAGHADLIREAIDGATMYELLAGIDGLPETPWLKPWRPAEPADQAQV